MFDNFILTLAQVDAPPNPPAETPVGVDPTQVTGPQQPGGPGTIGVPGGPGSPGGGPGGGPAGPPPRYDQFIWIFIVMMGVMLFFSFNSQRKEKKKRAELLSSLKKGDRIQTVGGILGTVVEVRDSDVVVKVDENNNSRVKFVRSAIQSVAQE